MVRISNEDLISILENNSRASCTEIARKLGVTDTAVRKKIAKLENEGVIKKYTIEADNKKLGFEVNALIGIDTEPEKFVHVIEDLKKNNEVKSLFSSSGDHMIMAQAYFKDTHALTSFVKKLGWMEGVIKICPAIILEKIK